jgi:TIR domain-containing protein
MNRPELAELHIEVSASDATEEDLDRMTRQLLSELRETDVESAVLSKGGDAPQGTKSGDSITMGSIVVSALPAVLPAIVGLVQAWAARGQGRTVKFKGKVGGAEVEFEGSPQELQKLLASLEEKETLWAEGKEEHHQKAKEDSVESQKARAKNDVPSAFNIFISYRRADSADVAGRIYDRLTGHFGKSAIFKDVDSIPLGIDFKEHLKKAVSKCKIFLVVIGDRWLEATGSMQENRLHDPGDFVRIEIEAALNKKIRIIPLLVHGASMPAEEKLPPSLQKLIYRNGIPVRSDPDFHRDMDRLIAAISELQDK